MKPELDAAQETAVRLLARRDHSELELRQKLQLRGFSEQVCDHVIRECHEKKWLSESRYVEQMIHERTARGVGPLKIMAELRAKGVSEGEVESVHPQDEQWLQVLRQLYQKRFHNQPAKDEKEFAQRWRFLQNRGFTAEHIETVLEKSW